VSKEYTHELHREVRSISGGYTLEREERITIGSKEALYVIEMPSLTHPVVGSGGAATPSFPDMS